MPAGQRVAVGQPIARIRCQPGAAAATAKSGGALADQAAVPQLRPKPKSGRLILPRSDDGIRQFDVGLSTIATVEGGRLVSNRDLLDPARLHTNADVIRPRGLNPAAGSLPLKMPSAWPYGPVTRCWTRKA